MLQWAREKGCEWDEETCEYAAEGGHLEVLRWARANGCPDPQESIDDSDSSSAWSDDGSTDDEDDEDDEGDEIDP